LSSSVLGPPTRTSNLLSPFSLPVRWPCQERPAFTCFLALEECNSFTVHFHLPPLDPQEFLSSFPSSGGSLRARELLKRGGRPTPFCFGNGPLAIAFLRLFLGWESVAVTPLCRFPPPSCGVFFTCPESLNQSITPLKPT